MDDYPSLGQRFLEWAESGFYLLIVVMLALGTLFLGTAFWNVLKPIDPAIDPALRGLERLENAFGGDGNVQFAIAFYAGAIALALIVGVMTICRRLDLQTYYLRSLSERRRASTPERMQP